MAEQPSRTDPLVLYDELLSRGEAPAPEVFCSRYPGDPSLNARIDELVVLRRSLDALLRPTEAPPPPEDLHLPGLRLMRLLGTGGMAAVYLAEQQQPRRPCAVKIVTTTSAHAEERFRREAELAARLSHSSLAAVYAFGASEGRSFLVTELVRGFSLRELLNVGEKLAPDATCDWLADAMQRLAQGTPHAAGGGRHTVEHLVALAAQVADGLGHAHRHGVIHRDVKPSNIIVGLDGAAKLIDFGIAVAAEPAEHVTDARLTRTGTFIGSYEYAAPEQLRGEHARVGPWTDTYALGATLYEVLAQRTPFEAASYADRLERASEAPRHGPRHYNKRVPAALDALVMRALHPQPEQRFYDGDELAEALRACPTQQSMLPLPAPRWPEPRRAGRWMLGLSWAAAAVLAVLYARAYREWRAAEREHTAATQTRDERALAWVLKERRHELARCAALQDPVVNLAQGTARFTAWAAIRDEKVLRLEVTSQTHKVAPQARQCLAALLERLEVPGAGLGEPARLRVDLRIDDLARLDP